MATDSGTQFSSLGEEEGMVHHCRGDVYQVHGWQRAKFIGVSGRGATCVGVLLGKWFARWKTEKTEDVLFTPIGVYTSLFKTL